uniref:Phenylacetate-CoA ligase n=1 Tax=Candidatus Kentrum sp. UNK TaxID=2126344 RepID=A0A451ARY6_9GAMM|nr:MAG: phenylacetate-CoA ligase [Candidatus Kentron sp. UNK]VFK68798.1 MAG: phenylacetate-CoA ligase [Candidatus Kentron sp. UNK]
MPFEQTARFRTDMETTVFPAIFSSYPAMMLSTLHQLEQSQWWSPERILTEQFRQLNNILCHAYDKIPFYQSRLKDAGIDPHRGIAMEQWKAIPFLMREDILGKEERVLATSFPKEHGARTEARTSGSTGKPIRVYGTELTQFLWEVFGLRDHYWHKRDFGGKLVAIRYVKGDRGQYPEGIDMESWGRPAKLLYHTGTAAVLDIKRTDLSDQLEWLSRQNPEYFLTYPSNALQLARLTLERGLRFPSLRELRLMGEVVDQETRDICREAWCVPISDMYSAYEAGYLALQCQEVGNYHIQSENVHVEIVDEQGQPCAPGETGKVVLTTLHNFAMPLIRYEIGDYAEVGEPCPCGRGLPVIRKILGRATNMLHLPTGERYWPVSGWWELMDIAPIRQHQIIQQDVNRIEARLVTERALTGREENKMREVIWTHFGYKFHIDFSYHDRIERSGGGSSRNSSPNAR